MTSQIRNRRTFTGIRLGYQLDCSLIMRVMTVAEQVLQKLQELPPEKQEEVLQFVTQLADPEPKTPRKSLLGL